MPFKTRGRSYEGWDCWGLLCMAYLDTQNILLPFYDNGEYKSIAKDRDKIKDLCVTTKETDWKPVKRAKMYDVAMIYIEGLPVHVGMMVNQCEMIHALHGINTCVQSLKQYRVEGIYRHKCLMK